MGRMCTVSFGQGVFRALRGEQGGIGRKSQSMTSLKDKDFKVGYPHPGGQGQIESKDSPGFARRPHF